jgi:hypothetical protein
MQSQPTVITQSPLRSKPVGASRARLQLLASRFLVALSIWRERRALRTASDEVLRDIGVDRRAAIQESRRTFFDLPADRIK